MIPCPSLSGFFFLLPLSSLAPSLPGVWLDTATASGGMILASVMLITCKTHPLHWATKTTWRPRELLRATRQCRRACGQCGHVTVRTGYAIIKKTKKN